MKFAVFICTHGRPDKQYTYEALRSAGYTGQVVFVVDDEDSTKYQYVDKYGTDVVVFNKQKYIDATDTGTNSPFRKTILYAKCFCEDLARDMGLDAFVISDDDTKQFRFRYVEGEKLRAVKITQNFDNVVDAFINYMFEGDLTALSFGYTSSYLKGISVFDPKTLVNNRVAYNFVFRNTKHEVDWRGCYGEDLTTAATNGMVGNVWMNMPVIQNDMVVQATSDGGMTDLYQTYDSFALSEFMYIFCPTGIKIMYYKNRFYGSIVRENTFPKIISSKHQLK